MILNVKNPKNEITTTYTSQTYIIAKLTTLLFNKTIVKNKHIKRIIYNYNYSNKNTITFVIDNNYKLEFVDIPTSMSLLNEYEIEKLIKGGN